MARQNTGAPSAARIRTSARVRPAPARSRARTLPGLQTVESMLRPQSSSVMVWGLQSPFVPLKVLPLPAEASALSVAPDGSLIAVGLCTGSLALFRVSEAICKPDRPSRLDSQPNPTVCAAAFMSPPEWSHGGPITDVQVPNTRRAGGKCWVDGWEGSDVEICYRLA